MPTIIQTYINVVGFDGPSLVLHIDCMPISMVNQVYKGTCTHGTERQRKEENADECEELDVFAKAGSCSAFHDRARVEELVSD